MMIHPLPPPPCECSLDPSPPPPSRGRCRGIVLEKPVASKQYVQSGGVLEYVAGEQEGWVGGAVWQEHGRGWLGAGWVR